MKKNVKRSGKIYRDTLVVFSFYLEREILNIHIKYFERQVYDMIGYNLFFP